MTLSKKKNRIEQRKSNRMLRQGFVFWQFSKFRQLFQPRGLTIPPLTGGLLFQKHRSYRHANIITPVTKFTHATRLTLTKLAVPNAVRKLPKFRQRERFSFGCRFT